MLSEAVEPPDGAELRRGQDRASHDRGGQGVDGAGDGGGVAGGVVAGRGGSMPPQAPIAITDGDFSTPTRRTRVVTRPRGLKTLQALGLTDATGIDAPPALTGTETPPLSRELPSKLPDALPGGAFTPPPEGWTRDAQHVSAVDEFLAALPTPVPEAGVMTPPPEAPAAAESSFRDGKPTEAVSSTSAFIENASSAAELRRAALAAASEGVSMNRAASGSTDSTDAPNEPAAAGEDGAATGRAEVAVDAGLARDAPVNATAAAALSDEPFGPNPPEIDFDPREITAIREAQDLLHSHVVASHADVASPLEIEVTPLHTNPSPSPPPGPSLGGEDVGWVEASASGPDLGDRQSAATSPEVPPEPADAPPEAAAGGRARPSAGAELEPGVSEPVARAGAAGPGPTGGAETQPEASLSPLALTLAHMAEALHPDLGYLATDDVEFLEPVARVPALELPPSRARTNTPPPVPRHVRGLGGERAAAPPPPSAPAARPELPEALAERPRRTRRTKPWFEEIFDENYLRTLPFMTPQQTLREVDFVQASLNVQPGGRILDIGCGYGRHAIELVQRGLAVTGLDLSLPLLIRAADESQRRSLAVDFVHGDMRQMAFERQFDGAYCMLTSFGYFDEESNLKVAEGIARSLKPGGRLLLDVVNRDYMVGDLPARVWWEGDGCVVLEEVEFNFNTNRLLTHRSIVFDDGRQLDQEISVRAYSLHDLGKLLRQAGFRILEVSGSIFTRGHYFGATSRNLIVVAERRPD